MHSNCLFLKNSGSKFLLKFYLVVASGISTPVYFLSLFACKDEFANEVISKAGVSIVHIQKEKYSFLSEEEVQALTPTSTPAGKKQL